MTMRYALATLGIANTSVPAIEVNGKFWDLGNTDLAPLVTPERRGLMGLFADWPTSHSRLKSLAEALAAGKGSAPTTTFAAKPLFQTPLQYPGKMICTGMNFYDHLEEAGMSLKKEETYPPRFFKTPTTTLVGCGKSVRYPTQTEKLDWEIEMVAVIGKHARSVKAEHALDYVAGYANGCDLSARDRQLDPRHVRKSDTIGGKSFDDAAPVGPIILPAEFAGDAQRFSMVLTVNGTVEQNGSTSGMIWSIAEQIEEATRHMTLEPGDMIMTGTPSGVGHFRGKYLHKTDRVTCAIGPLGVLDFEIV